MVEDEEYRLLDIQQPVPQGRFADSAFGEGGYSIENIYRLKATEKLVEYGIMTSGRSSAVKAKLEALELVEDKDYSLLQDILQQWAGSRGIKHTKVYRLEALSPQATEKLIEYGIVTSNRSSTIKEKLDALALVENEEYLLLDIQQQVSSGTKYTKVYRREAPSPQATAHSRSV